MPCQMGPYDTLHLINLVTLDDQWRNAAAVPPVQTNIGLRYYIGNDTIRAVYLASPELNFGQAMLLPYTSGQDKRGRYVQFTVPRLVYWDMVYLKRAS